MIRNAWLRLSPGEQGRLIGIIVGIPLVILFSILIESVK
jgi:hypothetical protein